MPNSFDLDCFIASLPPDFLEFYPKGYAAAIVDIYGEIEARMNIEKGLEFHRAKKALKQSLEVAKKTQTASASTKTIVYNLRTAHDLKLYASLKTASPQ